MKSTHVQMIAFTVAGACLWGLTLYGDTLDALARVVFSAPIGATLLYFTWTLHMASRQNSRTKMRATCREAEQRNRIMDLQHCFLDTLIAMDLGLERCSRLADRDNRALADEIAYLQDGIRELKENTLDSPGKDFWLAPLV